MFQGNFSFFCQRIKMQINFGVLLQHKDLNFILYLETEEMCGYGLFFNSCEPFTLKYRLSIMSFNVNSNVFHEFPGMFFP